MIEAPIGRGMFGAVYAARHPLIDAPVAIKVLGDRYARDAGVIGRFVQEARAASRVRHANVVEVFNFGRLPDGRRYLVMERLEGRGLDARLAADGRLSADAALAILRPIASALAHAHAAGVVHRDVKPANIVLGADGTPKLVDFGVAKVADGEAISCTQAGIAVGTPAYMAPEQCLGATVTAAADVYALGVVAFEMLTGRLPYLTTSQLEMMNAHVGLRAPAVHRLAREYAPAVSAAVRAMLHKDPARRPEPVAAIEALARALSRCSSARRRAALGVLLLSGLVAGSGWTAPTARVEAAAIVRPLAASSAPTFTPAQKAEILRRHLVDGVDAATLCAAYQLAPGMLARWRAQLFANAATALKPTGAHAGTTRLAPAGSRREAHAPAP